jgi:hypothetical protein
LAYNPIQLRTLAALAAALKAGVNSALSDIGQEALGEEAFASVNPGVIPGDLLAITYGGTLRSNGDTTVRTRKQQIKWVIQIYGFGAGHLEAQARAIGLEYAIVQTLDRDENRHLSGLLNAPLQIGESEVPYGGPAHGAVLCQLDLPIVCPVYVTRPEQEPS